MIFCFKSDILKYHLLLILDNFVYFGLFYLCNIVVYIGLYCLILYLHFILFLVYL